MTTLHPTTLASLPDTVARPRDDRTSLAPGIVHLGLGAFMRAHLAVATEAAISAAGDLRWGIVGVSLRQADTRDALAPQDGLYTVAVRDADAQGHARTRLQVVGCITRVLVAPESPAAVLDAIAHEATRIVSLTVTEKGYHHVPATGALRGDDDADLAHDLAHANAPRTALGFIVHGLARRRAAKLGPVTLLSLDNLPSNGDALRGLVRTFAARVDADLARWIDAHCTFPNSMVDRIVPRTTDADRDAVAAALGLHDAWPVMAEPFFDWAVEDRFAAGRPAWERASVPDMPAAQRLEPGVRFVAEAKPFETLKLRMVNGSHSAIAYLGVAAGWATVDEAIAQPALRAFVDAMMREEIEPTLHVPSVDLAAYRAQLLARFANPALAHRTMQIAMVGSQKVPQRWLGTVRDRLAQGQPVPRLALAVAAWLRHLRGRDEAGRAYAIDDPLAAELVALAAWVEAASDDRARAIEALRFTPVFGDLAQSSAFAEALATAIRALREHGVACAVRMARP